MGKKSKKKRSSAPAGAAANSGSDYLSSSATATTPAQDEADAILAEAEAEVPPQGWATELTAAEIAYKANSSDVDATLRFLKCLVTMRRWEKGKQVMKDAVASGVLGATDGDEKNNERFQKLRTQLQHITPYRVMDKYHKDFCRSVRYEGQSPDDSLFQQPTFCNLGAFLFAAVQGDVDLFENLVALGASIDYPPIPFEKVRPFLYPEDLAKAVAPHSCTALVLICATLMMQGAIVSESDFDAFIGPEQNQLKQQMEGQLEIAIQLVRMGADTSAIFDANHGERFPLTGLYHRLGMHGKTAFELAKMSKRKKLVQVMTEFRNRAVLKKNVQCRCGSRLPLRICHGCDFDDEKHLMNETNKDGRLCFRYSPLAPCPCKQTKKTYYKCCWDGAQIRFNNDRTGDLYANVGIPVTPEMKPFVEMMMAYKQQMLDAGADPKGPLFPGMGDLSPAEQSKMAADGIRTGLGGQMSEISPRNRKFDADVYAGCVERIPNYFFWRDDHWPLDKPELLLRVKQWNQALEQYCDAEGLVSEERERVVALHKASPFAPCGNPSCNQVEKEVKEFQKCSRCRKIGYCSRKCQAKHWKAGHKKECFAC